MKKKGKWLLLALVAVLVVGGATRILGTRRAQQAAQAQLATQQAQPVVELAATDVVRLVRR